LRQADNIDKFNPGMSEKTGTKGKEPLRPGGALKEITKKGERRDTRGRAAARNSNSGNLDAGGGGKRTIVKNAGVHIHIKSEAERKKKLTGLAKRGARRHKGSDIG